MSMFYSKTPSPSSAKMIIDLTMAVEYAIHTIPIDTIYYSEKEPSTYELNEKESIVR